MALTSNSPINPLPSKAAADGSGTGAGGMEASTNFIGPNAVSGPVVMTVGTSAWADPIRNPNVG
jgi:hypothetical protein